MRRALLALLFVALSCGQALANPAVVQSATAAGGTANASVALGAAPTNGNRITVIVQGTSAPTSVTDSNSIALTLEKTASGGGVFVEVYDYVASGSPTATYTCNINAASSCQTASAVEISGAPGTATYYSGTGSVSTPSVIASPIVANDIVWCGVNSGATAQTLAISGTTSLVAVSTTAGRDASYATATGTTSTCSGSASATNWSMAIADYSQVGTPHQLPTLQAGFEQFLDLLRGTT